MTAPYGGFNTSPAGETEEEKQARLLREQAQQDQPVNPSGGFSSAPSGASGSVTGAAPSQPSGTPRATSSTIPTGFMPPPPPPPPPTPDLGSQVTQFASDWMRSSNPYTSEAMTAARDASNANLAKSEADSRRGIEEWAQGRGLLGSSYEGEQRVNLAGTVQRAKGDFEAQLLQAMATAEALGKQNAGNLGLSAWTQQNTQNISQREIDLKAYEIQQAAWNEGRSLDLQEARDLAAAELKKLELGVNTYDLNGNVTGTIAQQRLEMEREAMEKDDTFRNAQLVAQRAGESADESYRSASLVYQTSQMEKDDDFRTAQLAYQRQGMDYDASYRMASLDYQQNMLDQQATEAALNRTHETNLSTVPVYTNGVLQTDADGNPIREPIAVAMQRTQLAQAAAQADLDRLQRSNETTAIVYDADGVTPTRDADGNVVREPIQAAIQRAQQTFAAAQADQDRIQQTSLQTGQNTQQTAMQAAQQTFATEQARLDRLQRSNELMVPVLDANGVPRMGPNGLPLMQDRQTALQQAQQTFTQAQAALDRTQQTALNTVAVLDAEGNPVPDPQNPGQFLRQPIQMAMQTAQQTFAAAQANLDRIQQTSMNQVPVYDANGVPRMGPNGKPLMQDRSVALQQAQQTFLAAQAVLDRRMQEQQFQDKLDFDTWYAEQQLGIGTEEGFDARQNRDEVIEGQQPPAGYDNAEWWRFVDPNGLDPSNPAYDWAVNDPANQDPRNPNYQPRDDYSMGG